MLCVPQSKDALTPVIYDDDDSKRLCKTILSLDLDIDVRRSGILLQDFAAKNALFVS